MKISVVIPCYNCETSIAHALNSIFKQEETDWEIILVDNNSTDNTLEILKEYERSYPNQIRVFTESKRGAPFARNKGLVVAKGDWIQFLDADDELLPSKFKRQLQIAYENNADVICGAFVNEQVFNGKFKIIRKFYHLSRISLGYTKGKMHGYILKTVKYPDTQNIWKSLIGGNLGITSANLFKREKILNINGWDNNLTSSQEYDLMFRLLTNGARLIADTDSSAIRYQLEKSVSSLTDHQSVLRVANNYINLRFRIIAYLENTGKLTHELNRYNQYILYKYLMRVKELAPSEISAHIELLKAEIPLSIKIQSEFIYIFRALFKK